MSLRSLKNDGLFINISRHRMKHDSHFYSQCSDSYETTLHVMQDCSIAMIILLNVVNLNRRQEFFECNLKWCIEINLLDDLGSSYHWISLNQHPLLLPHTISKVFNVRDLGVLVYQMFNVPPYSSHQHKALAFVVAPTS